MNTPPPAPVTELALRCLDDIDDIVEGWLAQVELVDPYGSPDPPVSRDELRGTALTGLDMLLRHIATGSVSPGMAGLSERVGERRAGQGVPLKSLLAAARLDARVLWQAMNARVTPEALPGLIAGAHLVWEAVEQHVTGLMTGYQRAVLEMGRQREDQRRAWFTRLMDNQGRNPDVVRDAGRVLGFDPSQPLLAVVAHPGEGAALRAAEAAMAGGGVHCYRHESPTGDVLIVQPPARTAGTPRPVLAALAGVRCGVSPVVAGLSEVSRAVRLASAAAGASRAGAGPRRLEDAWLDVFVGGSRELAAELARQVLGPLSALGGSEGERLLETVRIHLAGSGSVADTAAALYCHRNTVQHRFARFRELTGRDVRVPEDAAVVALALRAAETLA
ncbi:CdaR family transcriptional regulator [Microbispora sp. KK1-11]|uniref:PucR family transcriptional regulator n=1 Tax=Microbispora sp. KK1-11 TaxID=2053005 RepID=UPI00115AD549|nr:helix-turn-helix domain-containing protein [Microbispora sp. KK1-11]TQS27000.1 PucR family transcriptional regulator [Microbispora sp. KK1-11]